MKLLVISMPWHFHGNFVVLLYSKMCSGWVEQVCDCLNCCTWSLGHSGHSCPAMILKPVRANMICILCKFMIIEHYHEVYNCWLKASAMTAINMRMRWVFPYQNIHVYLEGIRNSYCGNSAPYTSSKSVKFIFIY